MPQDFIIFIGVCEFLGGAGLIVPAMTGVKPKVTPFAAFGLALVMILAAVFHIVRGEYNFVPINLVLGGVAAFIAYGLFVRPIAPASISTFRVLTVLGAMVLVDFAPVWYSPQNGQSPQPRAIRASPSWRDLLPCTPGLRSTARSAAVMTVVRFL